MPLGPLRWVLAAGSAMGCSAPASRRRRRPVSRCRHTSSRRISRPGRRTASRQRPSSRGPLRALGGDAFPSFGGWSADQGGTEIADSCKDVAAIAAAYESVITTYDVTRLDMDVEGRSLTKTAGIDWRNQAIAMVEAWAAQQGRPLQISYDRVTRDMGGAAISAAQGLFDQLAGLYPSIASRGRRAR